MGKTQLVKDTAPFHWRHREGVVRIYVPLDDLTANSKTISVKVTETDLNIKVKGEDIFDADLSFKTNVPTADENFWKKSEGWIVVRLANKNDDLIYSPIVAPVKYSEIDLEGTVATIFANGSAPLAKEVDSEHFMTVADELGIQHSLFEAYAKTKIDEENERLSKLEGYPQNLSDQERADLAEQKYIEAQQTNAQELEKKIALYRESANLGHVRSRINIAKIQQRNTDQEAITETLRYFTLAAVQNRIPAAMFQAGQIYLHGYDVTADPELALMFFAEGAIQGNVNCICAAADVHALNGKNAKKVLAYWHLALNRGSAKAAHAIGGAYKEGMVEKSFVRALQYYTYAHFADPEAYAIPKDTVTEIKKEHQQLQKEETQKLEKGLQELEDDVVEDDGDENWVDEEEDHEELLNAHLDGMEEGDEDEFFRQAFMKAGVPLDSILGDMQLNLTAPRTTDDDDDDTVRIPTQTRPNPALAMRRTEDMLHRQMQELDDDSPAPKSRQVARIESTVQAEEEEDQGPDEPGALWKLGELALTGGFIGGLFGLLGYNVYADAK